MTLLFGQVFEVCGRESLIDIALELEKAALADPYFVERKLYPNVDFYSGLIYKAMGFPTDFFPVLFGRFLLNGQGLTCSNPTNCWMASALGGSLSGC